MKRNLFFISLLFAAAMSWAVPAKRGIWKTIRLADGTEIRAELRGDEHSHWMQDENGKAYVSIKGSDSYMEITEKQMRQRNNAKRANVNNRRSQRLHKMRHNNSFFGQKKALVILVEFTNKTFLESNNLERYKRVINEVGFKDGSFYGSVRDYFLAQSDHQFDLNFDVVGPYKLNKPNSYYGENNSNGDDLRPGEMIAEALQMADNDVDFSQYDWDGDGEVEQVYIVYAGNGEADGGASNTIWPHEWTLEGNDYGSTITLDNVIINTYACGNELNSYGDMTGVGTMCHEFSHCMGFPDFYDISYRGNNGTGRWDLMCSGSYNGDGYRPAGYTSYERMVCGWKKPIELVNDTTVDDMKAINEGGETFIIYNKAYPDEYLLLENRNLSGWDAGLSGSGLLVLYVDYDEDIWNKNIPNATSYTGDFYNSHQRMTVIGADNNTYSEYGDPYPYLQNDSLTNTSKPAAKLYHPNVDGKKFMNVGILDIKRSNNAIVSFNFRGANVTPIIDEDRPENAIFYESFNLCSGVGGNDDIWSGATAASAEFVPDMEGWQSQSMSGANKCAKFGSGSKKGEVTSPQFTINGETTLSFLAAPWGSDGTDLTLSVSGNATIEPSEFTMTAEKWTKFTTTITGEGTVSITFTPSKRLFLDQVAAVPAGDVNAIVLNTVTNKPADNRIYSIDGRFVGNNFNILGKGIYIINGKKIVK